MSEKARRVVKKVKNPSKMGTKRPKMVLCVEKGQSVDVNGLKHVFNRPIGG